MVNINNFDALLVNPEEKLDFEIKPWLKLDRQSPHGIARLVRGVFALRNFGGGFLLIGFDDNGRPIKESAPSDVRREFFHEKIKQHISKYASQTFEIEVFYPKRDGQEYPLIKVPRGIKTPVATTKAIQVNDREIIKRDAVFYRTLNSNNKVSSSEIPWKDWDDLTQTCFDNRGHDIGRFLRRHLDPISDCITQLKDRSDFINQSRAKAKELATAFKKKLNRDLNSVGWEEFSIRFLASEIPIHHPDKDFLRLISHANPSLSGWPLWMDTQSHHNQTTHPYVVDNCWEANIEGLKGQPYREFSYGFWRIEPPTNYFHRRILAEDERKGSRSRILYWDYVVENLTELICIALKFGKVLGYQNFDTKIRLDMRLENIKDRVTSNGNPSNRLIVGGENRKQEIAESSHDIPLELEIGRIWEVVHQMTVSLFVPFDGFSIGSDIVEKFVEQLLGKWSFHL